MGNSHPGSFLIGTTKNKRIMVILNAQLDWKVGQGHSVSTKFINLEDITLNISKNPSKNDGAMQQTRLIMEVFCNQGVSLFVTWRGFSNFLERPMSSSSAGISNQNWSSYTPKGFFSRQGPCKAKCEGVTELDRQVTSMLWPVTHTPSQGHSVSMSMSTFSATFIRNNRCDADDKVNKRFIQQSMVHNPKTDNTIWLVFSLFRLCPCSSYLCFT